MMEDTYKEINEINLIDLMFYCLKRWRGIVVCMVLLSTFAGAYKYQATTIENQLKKEKQIQQSAAGQAESEEFIFESPISSAATFVIIGLIGGVCLICLIFSIIYVSGGKLHDGGNFQQKFGIPLLGVIRKKEEKKKLFRFVDCWIRRLEEGPCAKIPRNEQIKIAIVNAQNAILNSEEKMKKVMLAGTVVGSDVMNICEQLMEEIEGVTFSSYKQIVFYAEALKKLESYDGVLFIEKMDESYEKLIKQEKKLAFERNVKVLGAIVFE